MYDNNIRVRNQAIVHFITNCYSGAKKISNKVNVNLITNRVEYEYHLTPCKIKQSRIIKRYQRTKHNEEKLICQNKSTLHEIEDTIVEFALQRSLIKYPFNQEEFTDFPIVQSTMHLDKIDWQPKTKTRDDTQCIVGDKLCYNFKKRHPILADKFVVKYGVTRSEWATMENLTFMYNNTYAEVVNAGVVIEVDDEEYLDLKGNVVGEYDDGRLGNKTKFQMVYPMNLLFADKVGCNTNTEKDKTNSERRIYHRDNKAQQVSSSSDHHYTTFPFTNELNEPGCCIIIIHTRY